MMNIIIKRIYIYPIIFMIEYLILNSAINLSKIENWLIGINFTLAVFSINSLFFGYQFSRYKSLIDYISKKQWINIGIILLLPLIPLIVIFFHSEWYYRIALLTMLTLLFSFIDNIILLKNYLDPKIYINKYFSDKNISKYIDNLYKQIIEEVEEHEQYLKKLKDYKMPMDTFKFYPNGFGLENDLWDKGVLLLKTAFDNTDYSVFQECLKKNFDLIYKSYKYKSDNDNDNFKNLQGLQIIAHDRFQSIIRWIYDKDTEGIFISSIVNYLCRYLKSEECLKAPLDQLENDIAENLSFLGTKFLLDNREAEAIKILNTLHLFIQNSISTVQDEIYIYNVSTYCYLIKRLGSSAIKAQNGHYLYRCLEKLSYIGCNSAKNNYYTTVIFALENIVQLGREARQAKIGCFDKNCIIPIYIHAEEFMGHILTWLIKDEKLLINGACKTAYSRLRGFHCDINPNINSNPKLWIKEELDENQKKIPYTESSSNRYGYSFTVNYSNFDDLTEYKLSDSIYNGNFEKIGI